DGAATEAELQTVLPLFEQYRGNLTEENQRDNFFDAEQNIYDIAIDFAYSRQHNSQQAFEYSEASRARSLLDIIQNGAEVVEGEPDPVLKLSPGSNPYTLQELRERMPDHVQILHYA